MSNYMARPMSRLIIRNFANMIKEEFDYEREEYFDILTFVEIVLVRLYPDFEMHIVPDKEMPREEAYVNINTHALFIKESVYEGAMAGNKVDRYTIAHEVGHMLMHDKSEIKFARNKYINTCMDPEWQANTFAAELLCPIGEKLLNGTVEELSNYYGVSKKVVEIQKSYMNKK